MKCWKQGPETTTITSLLPLKYLHSQRVFKTASAVVIVFSAFLYGCDSGSDSNAGNLLNDDNANGVSTAPPDASGCTEKIEAQGRVFIPTQLVNSAAACDYYVDGSLEFYGPVTIEPGTTVVMGQGSSISFNDDSTINAVGTASSRITIRGEVPLQGFWHGVKLFGTRPSRIEYVDIMDAGTNSNSQAGKGGLRIAQSTLSLVDVSVSNSLNHGLNIWGSTNLTEFSNNRFFGNVDSGVYIIASLVPMLDTESDYLGIASPNLDPVIKVDTFNGIGRNPTWKGLNAPYNTGLLIIGLGGRNSLTLDPGAHWVFRGTDNDLDHISLSSGSELTLNGTADNPVRITARADSNLPWEGIEVFRSTVTANHAIISGAETGILLEDRTAQVQLQNTVLSGHENWGIDCDEPTESGLQLGAGVTFENNGLGEIGDQCGSL